MKRICVLVLTVLVLLPGIAFCDGKITFEGVMNAAQTKTAEEVSSEISFDDFCNRFMELCNAWDASWDTNNVTILSNAGDPITFEIDGVQITCDKDIETHPIQEVAVLAGTDSTTYNMGIKSIALMAVLEYDAPKTVFERKSILDAVTKKITDSMYFMSLIATSKEDSEIIALVSNKFTYSWRKSGGRIYFVAK